MRNKINLGIIGKNFGYHVIYKSFLKNAKYKVRAFCFKSKEMGSIKIPKNIKIYSSWKKLILDKKINAVAIATPPSLHKNIIKFAIKNRKHVFCEKPLGCSYKEASFICNLIKKKKNIAHIVNYEFAEITAFKILKKKILNNKKVKKIYLNWFIDLNRRSSSGWKENHHKGGGILFNYICHSIYYLEFLFGKIVSVNTNIVLEKKKKVRSLKGFVFFKNGLFAKLELRVGSINKSIEPIHQLKISTDKITYHLKTKLNSLKDKFKLIESKNNSNTRGKILFKSKENQDDFRIEPTKKNSEKFSNWILKGQTKKPNLYDAKRIHLIINKMILSSKRKSEVRFI